MRLVISFITKLVKTITFNLVLVWTIAGLATVIGFIIYEHRDDLFEATLAANKTGNVVGSTFTVSNDTKNKIRDFVIADDDIIGFGVFSADIRLNLRITNFFFGDGQKNSIEEKETLNQISRLRPLFTSSELNNRYMVKLINGEFYCVNYTSTLLSRSSPDINTEVISVCRASLPPYYGHFAGFLTIYLRNDPDIERQIILKKQLETFAVQIYFKDVVPTTHKPKT